jgi:hypothetical protein
MHLNDFILLLNGKTLKNILFREFFNIVKF